MAKTRLKDLNIGDIVYSLGCDKIFIEKVKFYGVYKSDTEKITVSFLKKENLTLNIDELTSWVVKNGYRTFYFNELDALEESLKRLKNKNKTFKNRKEKLNQDIKDHLSYIEECENEIINIKLNS